MSGIAVVDYGRGNLRSVQKALERVGLSARITGSPKEVDNAAAVVLPGVGAFGDCMRNLDRLNLIASLLRAIEGGKPFLGICLGLQILFTESEEFGPVPGLNVFPGRVVRFPHAPTSQPLSPSSSESLKVPHIGWNQIHQKQPHPVLAGIPEGGWFYFVHSYYVVPVDPTLAATTTCHGIEFVSSIAKDNVFACQFHPEKSQQPGLQLLKNFGALINGAC